MTSPTHDATALAVAVVCFPPQGDVSPLSVSIVLIGLMGLMEAVASARHRPRERAWRAECRELKARGVPREAWPREPRWPGPRRNLTRPMRLLAVIGAGMVSVPLGIALACARLPDQLEVGPIDHRRLTHFLLTAAVVVFGARYGLLQLVPGTLSSGQAEEAWRALAVGYGTHLAMDACTRSGVPLLWPLVRRDLHVLPFRARPRTGHLVDTLVMLGALAGVAMLAQG